MRVNTKTQYKAKPSEVKAPQRLSLVFLDNICSYLISENKNIRRKGYSNILNAFKSIDLSSITDDDKILRIAFIEAALEARVTNGIDNRDLIIDCIKSAIGDDEYNSIQLRELNNKDVDYINTCITDMLNTSTYSYFIGSFVDIAKKYEEASPRDKSAVVDEWIELVDASKNKIRQNKVESADDQMYSLQPGEFEDYVMYTHADLSSPSNRLATGMMGVNQMLNGGFQSKRTYCIFGLQGEGKSSTLVNLCYQIKTYNKNYKTKDPTKRPCVVYLTMEDHPEETLSRQFSMFTGQGDLINHEAIESIRLMREAGLVITEDNPIDIIVKYKPNESVDTSYIYDLIDDLSERGYEAICVVLDYLNRIRSVNRFSASEERLRLGAVVNELKTIATELNIPIITAAQFNREANSKIDEARDNGIEDLINLLGRTNIAESMKILDNLDGALMIVPEYDCNGNKYLGIKLAKNRWKADFTTPLVNGKKVIHHPYTDNVSMRLVEDVPTGLPVHKLTLVELQKEALNPDITIDRDFDPDSENEDFDEERYMNELRIKETTRKTMCKEAGIENKSKYDVVGGVLIPKVEMMSEEDKAKYSNSVQNKIAHMNNLVYDRYSDMYTWYNDPRGSKMQRYVDDYNAEFGTHFVEADYRYLKDNRYFMRMSKKENSPFEDRVYDGTKLYAPIFRRVEVVRPLFTRVTSEDRAKLLSSRS